MASKDTKANRVLSRGLIVQDQEYLNMKVIYRNAFCRCASDVLRLSFFEIMMKV